MRTYLVAVVALLLVPSALHAQYAEASSQIAERESISPAQALWLVGSAAGSLGPGTQIEDAAARLSVLEFPTAFFAGGARSEVGGVTVAEFSFLLMQVEEVPGGFWYGVAPASFTAFRHLQRTGVVGRDMFPSSRLSGAAAIDLTRRYLDFAAGFDAVGSRP